MAPIAQTMAHKGKATGQGYNFHGPKARMMADRLAALKRDPEGARRLMAGKAPKDYPDGKIKPKLA